MYKGLNDMSLVQRDCGIEVLRCLLMFLITLGHCCFHGPYATRLSVTVTCTLTCFCVDAFAFISGYYSIKTTPIRMLKILGQGLYATLIVFLLSREFHFSMGWYGNAYLVLMIMAPIVNAGIDGIAADRGRRGLYACVSIYIVYMFLMWLPLEVLSIDIGVSGWYGHSPFLLLGMYLLGRIVAKYHLFHTVKRRYLFVIFVALEVFTIGWSALGRRYQCISPIKAWDYQSPLMVSLAVVAFLMFRAWKDPTTSSSRTLISRSSLISKVACILSPSMFVVYLLHDGAGAVFARQLFSKLELFFVDRYSLMHELPLLSVIVTAIMVYFSCIAVDMCRRLLARLVIELMNKFLHNTNRTDPCLRIGT